MQIKDIKTNLISEGEVTEWPIVQHWKCCVPQGTAGSNPALSAIILKSRISDENLCVFREDVLLVNLIEQVKLWALLVQS